MLFSTMTCTIQRYVIFMWMKLLLQETAWLMKKERLPYNILDLFYKPTWSMLVKLWNNTCTTFHCYLSMSLHFTWYGKCGKRSFFCALSYKWLNMSSSASKEMAAASFQGSNGNLKKRLLEDGVKESTVLDVCQGCMFKERRR